MRWSALALFLAFAVSSEAAVLRGRTESLTLQLEEAADWTALDEASEAESEDRSFLLAQLDATESQLKEFLQIVAAPVAKTPEPKKEAAPVAKKEEAAKAKTAKDFSKDEDPMKVAASLGLPKLNSVKGLKGQMALAPMLAMLKGLYEESKERISQQNVREEKSKKWFAEKEAAHKEKQATIDGKFANHTLSEEFRTNETRDETRYFKYWQGCRERQHRQFHTNLKIQHAMMNKVKKMIGVYDKALSPKAEDKAAAKKQLRQMTGMPEIVFLQGPQFDEVKREVTSFCLESLEEVKKEKDELHNDSSLAIAWKEDGVTY